MQPGAIRPVGTLGGRCRQERSVVGELRSGAWRSAASGQGAHERQHRLRGLPLLLLAVDARHAVARLRAVVAEPGVVPALDHKQLRARRQARQRRLESLGRRDAVLGPVRRDRSDRQRRQVLRRCRYDASSTNPSTASGLRLANSDAIAPPSECPPISNLPTCGKALMTSDERSIPNTANSSGIGTITLSRPAAASRCIRGASAAASTRPPGVQHEARQRLSLGGEHVPTPHALGALGDRERFGESLVAHHSRPAVEAGRSEQHERHERQHHTSDPRVHRSLAGWGGRRGHIASLIGPSSCALPCVASARRHERRRQ